MVSTLSTPHFLEQSAWAETVSDCQNVMDIVRHTTNVPVFWIKGVRESILEILEMIIEYLF